ncbi:hypothetical protein [Synechococcus phage Yong-M3-232]|nr:hypothetical protein [Synechococcus phage Yong-M3-232]
MSAPQINLKADKRVPFDVKIPEMGVNYSGATLLCEIRQFPGDQGAPLVSLSVASPPSEGISVTYDPDYPDPEGQLPNGASIVRLIVSEATLEALPYSGDASKLVELNYDIHITPSGGTKFIFCAGKFIIDPGVTL